MVAELLRATGASSTASRINEINLPVVTMCHSTTASREALAGDIELVPSAHGKDGHESSTTVHRGAVSEDWRKS